MMLNAKYARIMSTVWRWTRSLFLETLMLGTVVFALLAPFSLLVLNEYQHFSPIQKYWLFTYWRSEFSRREQSAYRLLLVEDANHQKWLAGPDNVVPGRTLSADGKEIPFALTTKSKQKGARLVLEPPALTPNQYLSESLRDQIYGGQDIVEMGQPGLDFGVVLAFFVSFYWLFRCTFLWIRFFVNFRARNSWKSNALVMASDHTEEVER
ncbi:MAG TPA: hypothetical protein VFP59_03675 [Candidatus Angelobacter sp.]|nr:hypothetical protein [Candidatus Angelobacter sp.]